MGTPSGLSGIKKYPKRKWLVSWMTIEMKDKVLHNIMFLFTSFPTCSAQTLPLKKVDSTQNDVFFCRSPLWLCLLGSVFSP